ncbi:MAG TPA: lamin tail domain-containing protein [Prolixibacteraceae bacterium]|nr:lamin tail domain-containing protein [Prolixibacteraceae bacterium]
MKLLLLMILLLGLVAVGKSQVVINEFMASNTGTIQDPDYGASADWIELFNTGNNAINLNGYAISDNISEPQKWVITSDIQLPAKGYVLIWADGMSSGLHTSFKLSADFEEIALADPSGKIIDSLSYGLQEANISMGRTSDGASQWGFFNNPTPGSSNTSGSFEGIVKNLPDFSPLGGIFTQPVSVTINNTFGGTVRYTLDGSEPNEASPVYENPIPISKHTVIRARIYQDNKMPGDVITNSYFINTDGSIGSLPVVSIATAPENFWDPVKGIYVQRFKPDWEVPINIELFENDGSDRAGFNLPAGTKINGLYSWQLPQKMLGIYFRKAYGASKLEYPLFFDKKVRVFNSFALRASGNDWSNTLFRDGMIQNSTQPGMDIEIQGFRACVVYVNGQYMGIHNIRSKVDEAYVVESNELGDAKIDMIAYEDTVEAGDMQQYAVFKTLYKKDLSIQANYDVVAQMMDIDNFTDFMIAEIYCANTSVDHNVMAWKPKEFGQWRWLLADLDRSFGSPEATLISYYQYRTMYPFSNLLRNPGYTKAFAYRLADLLFTNFNPQRMNQLIDGFAKNIEAELPRHIARWKGTSSSYGNPIPSVEYWKKEVQKLKTFAAARPAVLLDNLTSYGMQPAKNLYVSVMPAESGKITFNGLTVQADNCKGKYPAGGQIVLQAQALDGYAFKGWALAPFETLIVGEDFWKYNDKGADLGSAWKEITYDDSSWAEGQAELGYGDGNEKTRVSYSGTSTRRNITTYFRKKFTVTNASVLSDLIGSLKYDDGAIVYLNGQEVIRANMPQGDIAYSTLASSSVNGVKESTFTDFPVDASLLKEGENYLAVELHQEAPNSTDISFDFKLSASKTGEAVILSIDPAYRFTLNEATHLVAFFERDSHCMVPSLIAENLTLDKSCSPYLAKGDIIIQPGATLTIEPGVEIWMPEGASMYVKGALTTHGTAQEPVKLMANPNSSTKKWGAVLIDYGSAATSLNYTVIEGASQGPNPTRNVAAISLFHSIANIDHLKIENVWSNPVAARYSDVSVTNSYLHSTVTGDLINFKYGKGLVENSEFVGNDQPDTDGIDYDDIENGIIRNCLIRDLHGSNSDAIDLGEKGRNILIDGVMVYNITDKGVSVGQQTTATIRNSIFVNCNLGAGLKDSCKAVIDHCTYYGCATPVATYEKNAGSAGGNVRVINSILSNSYESSFICDDKSTIAFSNTLSDNDFLPPGNNNVYGNPQFSDPGAFDFTLKSNSPALNAGTTGNMGADPTTRQIPAMVEFSAIGYNADGVADAEFVVIQNPGSQPVDLSGFQLSKGVTFTFPIGTVIEPYGKVIVTKNTQAPEWAKSKVPLFQWEAGQLADEGETIQLLNESGIIFDQLKYLPGNPWPLLLVPGQIIVLRDPRLDNHFGENWKQGSVNDVIIPENPVEEGLVSIYPNPASEYVIVEGLDTNTDRVQLFNLAGKEMEEYPCYGASQLQINVQHLVRGIYVLKCGSKSLKLVKK